MYQCFEIIKFLVFYLVEEIFEKYNFITTGKL